MYKIINISFLDDYKIVCHFNNGEVRMLDLSKSLDLSSKFAQKVIENDTYKKAKIGLFGEILWEEIGEMKDYDGSVIACAYDISPEYAYFHSVKI